MFIGYIIVAAWLAAVLLLSGRGKLTRNERVTTGLQRANVPLNWFPPLAALEIAGAVGLVAGIWLAPLGVAAAIGVILYFVGAVVAHLRAGDAKGVSAPLPLLLAAVAALVLRLLA
ncbi:DoxX family protein [Plantactinospora sp. S1510]|uniref:DoxX family protein n=1 Tax=Plantactinospora alkalitolerans TaxID=2789879 RepID=A0ABS0GXT5_9ACTN|nr:DoxX family protein [Plantactinospora alkalitolerans]MBF9130793.1 DoxX family protein [Plantactinospora alkalitolerans]